MLPAFRWEQGLTQAPASRVHEQLRNPDVFMAKQFQTFKIYKENKAVFPNTLDKSFPALWLLEHI